MRVKKSPKRKLPVTVNLHNLKLQGIDINNIILNEIRPLAKTRQASLGSAIKSSTVVSESGSPATPQSSPNNDKRKKAKFLGLKEQEIIHKTLREQKSKTFHKSKQNKSKQTKSKKTSLHTKAARNPYQLILVDPNTGKIIKKHAFSVRFDPRSSI